MSLIATYNEKRIDGKRTFELYEDSILCKGKTYFITEFEHPPIPLSAINPAMGKSIIRSPNTIFTLIIFLCVMVVIMFSALVTLLVLTINQSEYAVLISNHVAGLQLTIISALISLPITFLCFTRKVEFVNFVSNTDGRILINIAKAGPEKEKLAGFINLMVSQIEKNKKP